MILERLAYVSRSTGPAAPLMQASDILEQSVRNNRANSITGALTFTPSSFAQVLEGTRGSLDVLMLRLTMDTRHQDMTIVDRAPVPHRLFADWAMVAPTLTPLGQARLTAMMADEMPSMEDLTELMLEMLEEQQIEPNGPATN